MISKRGGMMSIMLGRFITHMGLSLLLSIVNVAVVKADELALSGVDIGQLSSDKLRIQLEMNGAALPPKVFQTNNPARIALDFMGVKNRLDKKMYPINQGPASNIYIAEANDRVRVVVNLYESVPFDTKVFENKVLLTLNRGGHALPLTNNKPAISKPVTAKTVPAIPFTGVSPSIATLLPEQSISGFDFKRGDKGEGRILISLANPNTVVNSKEDNGKVIVSFLNTRLSTNFSRRLDVSEFATPVKFIDTVTTGRETHITVTPQNNLYDYSLFQSEGLLTIEFRPLTAEEKLAQEQTRQKYTGERLSLNFQDIEIRSVIAILAEFTGQNVVAGDDVTGTITLKLDDVPWDEALDFIMMTKELGKFETGNVTLISPLDKIKDYKKKQQETEKAVEQLEPLLTEYIKINYARADDFRNLLFGYDSSNIGSCVNLTQRLISGAQASSSSSQNQNPLQNPQQTQIQSQIRDQADEEKSDKFSLLSPRGSAVVDSRTNTLIVRETPKRLEDVKKLIRRLDVPVRQVLIESRIVIAQNTFLKELGVKFGVAKYINNLGDGTQFGLGGPGSNGNLATSTGSIVNGVPKFTQTPANVELNDMLVDLGTATPYGALGMTLVKGADYVLNLELSAMQDQNRGEVISNPRVMTSDRCLAVIQQGQTIPYLSSSGNTGTNTVFIDAVLQLGVLPQITPEGNVIMGLFISKNDLGEIVTTNNDRLINKRELRTSVHVNNGETVVLGGVFENTKNDTTNSVPFFSDLPGIGFLFKRTSNQDDKKELLIFITPKVIKDSAIN